MSRLHRVVALVALAGGAAGLAGCGGGSGGSATTVAPDGAPYSYAVPSGFEAVSSRYPGKGPRFPSTVVPAGSSHEGYLGIYEVPLSGAEQALSGARLLARFEGVERNFYGGEGATLGPGRKREIAGEEGVCWRIGHFRNRFEGVVEADSCAIAAAGRLLLQTCTWKPQSRAVIRQGCQEMRAGLEVRQ